MEVSSMGLFRSGDRVRVVPKDSLGKENWTKVLGGRLDRTFPVLSQIGNDVIRVGLKGGSSVEVPFAIVKGVTRNRNRKQVFA